MPLPLTRTGPGQQARRFTDRLFASFSQAPGTLIALLVALSLVGVWQTATLAGGSRTVFPHLFYLPIVFATVRFGWRAAVLTALAAGVLGGPLLAADVATGTPQALSAWLMRLAVFVLVGVLLAWLTAQTRPGLLTAAHDALVSASLRKALRDKQIVVYYQPQIELGSGAVVGVEALARWIHPSKGLIAPADFIPMAERTGAISDIDRYVLCESTRQLALWRCQGVDRLTMAVNVSARRLQDPALVPDITAIIAERGIPPELVHLEITETAIIDNITRAAEQIQALHEAGVKIAIDDFGAGQSSLSYLHRFSVDVIKIDRSFISRVLQDPNASKLVAGMIGLFESLGMTVVAEGIETADQYTHLQSLRCEIGQGYHMGRPAPAAELTALLCHALTGNSPPVLSPPRQFA